MSEPRTLKITSPHMSGEDVRRWQVEVRKEFDRMHIDYPLTADGDYGVATRDATASLCHALGMIASKVMAGGVTPELRTRIRNRRLTAYERVRMAKRVGYRRALRDKHRGGGVAPPLAKILSSSWGYHPPVHDGVDLICPPRAAGYAICKAKVVRADGGGWWGKGAPSAAVAAKGDGIVIIRALETIGPIREGMNLCYGHAENPRVRVGDVVKAGDRICDAGLANAWHFHFMVNVGEGTRGVGDRDPMPIIRYAQKHS